MIGILYLNVVFHHGAASCGGVVVFGWVCVGGAERGVTTWLGRSRSVGSRSARIIVRVTSWVFLL
ncbi:MAG: hypothetical protein KIH04_02575, partial [Candidatus Freyarchaeota archaeon]|nr:hypothetical protein [Candidatus Jordarchaeia archaeon]